MRKSLISSDADKNERVSIVTGAGQGIGKAVASKLLQENGIVIIAEKDSEAGREAEFELSKVEKDFLFPPM